MQVFRGITHFERFCRNQNFCSFLTIGNFDGVHRGHLKLIKEVTTLAESYKQHNPKVILKTIILTFEPHPKEFFDIANAPTRLSTLHEKLRLLANTNVDYVVVCPFTADFAKISANDFVQKILCDIFNVKKVFIGDDFRFGAKRQGDFKFLQEIGKKQNFEVFSMQTFFEHKPENSQNLNERISSSLIRKALWDGDLQRANNLLGRIYSIDGQVRSGQQLGRKLGFATANLFVRHNPVPMQGVFAVEIKISGRFFKKFKKNTQNLVEKNQNQTQKRYFGVANLGMRPTINDKQKMHSILEVHIFDFNQNIYGEHIEVLFHKKLRNEQKFNSLEELQQQINIDCQKARDFFNQPQI